MTANALCRSVEEYEPVRAPAQARRLMLTEDPGERALPAEPAATASPPDSAPQLAAAPAVPPAVQLASAHERNRLRRDLHDGIGPSLATASMRLEVVRSLIETDPAAASAQLAQVHTDVLGALADVRRLLCDLRPPALDGASLPAALRALAARFEEASRQRLRIRVELPAALRPLPPPVELAAFWIASEAMTNVARHARADNCSVRVTLVGRLLHLQVLDDGVGIRPGYTAGLGTLSMRQRAVELGGRCTITRRAPRGTVVRARLPVDGPADDCAEASR